MAATDDVFSEPKLDRARTFRVLANVATRAPLAGVEQTSIPKAEFAATCGIPGCTTRVRGGSRV
jgi:hypothetical protein